MNIFDILGPIMVGPSSSHTAGAVKIGKVARSFLGKVESKHGQHGLHYMVRLQRLVLVMERTRH